MSEPMDEALIELTAPDGTVFQFRYSATIPYADRDYVVLCELEPDPNGEEQILITTLNKEADGSTSFVVVEEEDIIQAVFEKYCQMAVREELQYLPEEE